MLVISYAVHKQIRDTVGIVGWLNSELTKLFSAFLWNGNAFLSKRVQSFSKHF